jgi:hypothetical protein
MPLLVSNGETLLIRRRVDEPSAEARPHARLVAHLVGTIECTFKDIKSGLFNWERGRVKEPERVEVLLIGVSCALWVMWMLGRVYEHIPKRKPTTTTLQKRRKSIIKQGIDIFEKFKKKKIDLGHGSESWEIRLTLGQTASTKSGVHMPRKISSALCKVSI